jgi:hypothetical protein
MKKVITIFITMLIALTSFSQNRLRDIGFSKIYNTGDTIKCFNKSQIYNNADIITGIPIDTNDFYLMITKHNDGYYLVKHNKKVGFLFIGSLLDYYDSQYNHSLITKIFIGMGKDDVLKLLGEPKSVNKTITKNNINEQWVYDNFYTYIYVDNGVVTAYQTKDMKK